MQDEIWCCCKQSIIRIDSNGKIISTLFYVDEKDRRVELECFCVIDNNIWAGCAQIGRSMYKYVCLVLRLISDHIVKKPRG